jgi:hypothetical protein
MPRSLQEARLFTVAHPLSTGAAKIALYDELLCMLEGFLVEESAYLTLLVDGAHDGGGHLRAAHRALAIKDRRIIEDAGLRRASDSQLLQMVDFCAHAAFRSLQDKPNLDARFRRLYELTLSNLIYRPTDMEGDRLIRGRDYPHECSGCASERHAS